MRDKIHLKFFLILALILVEIPGIAQLRCKITHYSTEDGLSQEKATCLFKDRDGMMWFGTWNGIDRFDGHNFKTYKSYPGDKSNLKNNRINEIVEGQNGFLWLRADDKQVYRFDKRTGEFMEISKIISKIQPNKYIFDQMRVSQNGLVWLLSRNQGVVAISGSGAQANAYTIFGKNLRDSRHLPSNQINFFNEDDRHQIWIGTPDGLALLKQAADGIYRSINNPYNAGYDVKAMAEHGDTVIFATGAGQLICYRKSSDLFRKKEIIKDEQLNAVCISSAGANIYCSTSRGNLLVVDKSTLTIKSVLKADDGPVFSLYEDRKGLIWVEPQFTGVIKFDPANNSFKHFSQKIYNDYPYGPEFHKVFEDNNGNLWTNMKGGGFGYYDRKNDIIHPFFNDPLSADYQFSNMVARQYYDPAGILWLLTETRGIEKIVFQENDFGLHTLVPHSPMLGDNEVRSVYYDHEGRMWIMSKRKIHVFKDGKEIPDIFVDPTFNRINKIYSVLEDHAGNIWLGTREDGLFKAEPVSAKRDKYTLRQFKPDEKDINALNSKSIYSMVEDRQNRLWIGTYGGGINQLIINNGRVQFINCKNRISNYPKNHYQKIRDLELDPTGKLWIGTTDGLLIMDLTQNAPEKFRIVHYNKIPGDKESLGNNDIQYIYKDSRQRFWLSTSGGGLNLAIGNDPFRSLKFRSYAMDDGLPNDFILSTVEDNEQNLWVVTLRGISRFDTRKGIFKNYDSNDGIPKAGFSEGSSLKLPDGSLIFGAVEGYLSFNPKTITDRKIEAKMALTNFQVNGVNVVADEDPNPVLTEDINYEPKITLKHDQNTIGIEYSVLDFRTPNKQTYAYRLIGLDTTWSSNISNHRKVAFANLAPGNYTFQVKSGDANSYLKLPIKSLAIVILPPFWQTWWAYLIYIILAGIAIEVIRRMVFTMLRLRQRIAVEHQLTELKLNFFTNISHELRTPLSLILNPISAIVQKEDLSPKGKAYAGMIMKNANRMVRFINQLLDLRKVQSGKAKLYPAQTELIGFIKTIGEYFKELSIEKQISLKIHASESDLLVWVDTEKIDIVIYNLLANAFKFTPSGKEICVDIEQDVTLGQVFIRVIDQGVGVPQDKLTDIFELYYEGDQKVERALKGTGIGLALSKELIELHQGKIYAANNSAGGLTVTIELPLGNTHFNPENTIFADNINVQLSGEAQHESWERPAVLAGSIETETLPLVLLVEDNTDLRCFLAMQLSETYRVLEAADGQEGWQKALEFSPDLVLSDIMMPKMNGIELLDKLKNSTETSHIPVILLSAKAAIESQVEGLQYGADYYITKPFNNDVLHSVIANLIKQRKQIFDFILNGKNRIELSPGDVVITTRDEQFLKNLIKIVEERMVDFDFSFDTVIDEIGMSRSSLYKKLKSLSGLSPVEFLRDMRLKRGRQLLDAGEDNISQVAYAVGFSDPKYFGGCFKRQYNMLPSEYVKKRRSGLKTTADSSQPQNIQSGNI